MSDFEQIVLACMIEDSACCQQGLNALSDADFAKTENVALFKSIKRCAEKGAVDLATLTPFTQDDGKYAIRVASVFYPPSNFGSYLDGLQDQNRRRRTLAACQKAIGAIEANESGWESLVQDAAAQSKAGGGTVEFVGGRAIEAIDSLFSDRKASVRTGFPALDALTKGLCPGELTVLAARPSMGKTSLAMSIATSVAAAGRVVAVFSLETSEKMILRRAVYALSEKPENLLLCQNEAAMIAAVDAATKLSEMPLYIHDRALITADELAAQCYKVRHAKGQLDLIVIDYLQLIAGRNAKNATREQVVGEISRRMKLLALDLGVPVLLLSQLSRNIEHRIDKTPVLADLRESGAIEQDADCVLFLSHTDDEVPNRRRIIVAKNRNGRTGSVEVNWQGDIFRFSPIQPAQSAERAV